MDKIKKVPSSFITSFVIFTFLITVTFSVFITSCTKEDTKKTETSTVKSIEENKAKTESKTPKEKQKDNSETPRSSITLSNLSLEKYPTITTYISIIDAEDKPINIINIENFEVTEEDKAVSDLEIVKSDPVTDPLSVVLAIDISGSMAGKPLENAKLAAETFVNLLKPGDKAALVTFDQDVYKIVPLTDDKEALIKAIQGLIYKRDTALYQAIIDSSLLLKDAPDGRRIVIVLTDGKNDKANSDATKENAVTDAGSARAVVITVGLGEKIDVDILKYISNETGGRFFHAPSPEDLQKIYTLISDQIHAQFRMSFTSPFPTRPNREIIFHTIKTSFRYGGEEITGEREFLASTNPDLNWAKHYGNEKLIETVWEWVLYGLLIIIFFMVIVILVALIVKAARARN